MPEWQVPTLVEAQQAARAGLMLLLAYALALPVAWDREVRVRSAGLRTFPLVAVASCGYVVIARSVAQDDPSAVGRALEGLITGIGFLGAGAILKHDDNVRGTATAASVWLTAAIGAAVGLSLPWLAAGMSVLTFLTLRWVTAIKPSLFGEEAERED